MKKTFFAAVFSLCAVCLSGAELAVNFKADLAQTAPMADRVKNWVRNGNSKRPHIGTGEVTEENGVACFKIETTKINTEFYCLKRFSAKAGQTLEFEVTAEGTGRLLLSCYSYEASKKFFSPGRNLNGIKLVKDKKVYKSSIKLVDGKQGQKLAYILLAVGAGPKSNITIYDIKARITDQK
jgi:hypothetical protein